MSQNSVAEFLSTFTKDQLRELDLSLSPPGDSGTKSANHKAYVHGILKRHEGKKLITHALRLEALLPYKHVFLFAIGIPGTYPSIEKFKERIEKGFPGLFEHPKLLEAGEELEPEVCVFDKARKRFLVKFVHLVETFVWEWTDSRRKEIVARKRRHPVVVSIFPSDRLLTVSFPGYTQGTFPPDMERTTYADIARSACKHFVESTQIHIGEFPLRQTIELILRKEPTVKAVRRYVKGAGGRMMLDSREGPGSSEEFLSEKFRSEAHIEVSEDAIRAILSSMEAVDIMLHWKKKEIYTRIGFHDFAPEILFIWKSTEPSAALIDEVLATLVEYHTYAGTEKLSEAINFVDHTKPGEIISPTQVVQQFSISLDETLKILYRAMERGVVDILFRVKTEGTLLNFRNDWRKKLSDFPPQVEDERGHIINLGEHKNIEVAFMRLSA